MRDLPQQDTVCGIDGCGPAAAATATKTPTPTKHHRITIVSDVICP
jgi:hypothetical protein